MKDYFLNRLREKSTWFALFAVIAAFTGWQMTPEQQIAVAFLASVLAGAPGDAIQRIRNRNQKQGEHESLDDLISRGRK
jgi:hypothetical protein